jgi:hypothetical protein
MIVYVVVEYDEVHDERSVATATVELDDAIDQFELSSANKNKSVDIQVWENGELAGYIDPDTGEME